MIKVRNKTDGSRYVSFLDRDVAAGEVVEAPEFQSDGVSPIIWNDTTWEIVADDPPKGKSAAKTADTSGKADS